MTSAALANVLADTWTPDEDLARVEDFDATMGGDLAARVCLRIAEKGMAVDMVMANPWRRTGTQVVGGRKSDSGWGRVDYTHDRYERDLNVVAILVHGDELIQYTVQITVGRLGKNGGIRVPSQPTRIGILNTNAADYNYECTVERALVEAALGVDQWST